MFKDKQKREFKRGMDLSTYGQTRAFDIKEAEENREIPFVISNEQKDRHGSVILTSGWNFEDFKRNPIVDFNHRAMPSFWAEEKEHLRVIAKSSIPEIVGTEVHANATFAPAEVNPEAEEIFQMVLNGFIRSASVVFMPTNKGTYGRDDEGAGMENETYYYNGQDLYSWGPVTIPSNTGAGTREVPAHLKNKAGAFAFQVLRQICPLEIEDNDLKKLSFTEIMDFAEGKAIQPISKGLEPAIQRQRLQLGLI